MIGRLLAGHYRVLKVLGAGGFGETYIVEDIHLPGNPKCVLKHLKPASTDAKLLETARRLFQKEGEVLQHLGIHDQIPRLLAYFEENKDFYLVQELIEGHSLNDELQPGVRWSEKQVIDMLIEVLGILEFVHNQRVIHRDIKPDNLLRRNSDGKLVLIDFGAIKQVRNQTALGRQNLTVVIGTPGYMASEQSRGLPRPSSDLYALGMIGIQALTGAYPNELPDDNNTGEVMWQHLTSVSPGLADVLCNMTRYHFKDRYQSATEALQALKHLAGIASPPVPQVAVHNGDNLHELTLQWVEEGKVRTHKILESQPSKNPGTFRLGRDPNACDIVLSEPTISGLHVEIFFNPQRQRFYLRNLRQSNPPILDGQLLLAGEMPLSEGSSLRLGQSILRVIKITQGQYPPGYVPPDNPALHRTASFEPLPQTAQKEKQNNYAQFPTEITESNQNPPVRRRRKLPLLLGMSVTVAAMVSAIGAFALFRTGHLGKNTPGHNLFVEQSELCRVISPTQGREYARVRSQPQRDASEIAQLAKGDRVLFQQAQGDFVAIKLRNEKIGWVFRDQIQPCNTSEQSTTDSSPTPFAQPTKKTIVKTSPTPTAIATPQVTPTKEIQTQKPKEAEKTYEQGLKEGKAKGQETGKADAIANNGQGEMRLSASCTPSGDGAEYNRGFKEGCEQAYKEIFRSEREKNVQQSPTLESTPENNQPKVENSQPPQNTKPNCDTDPEASGCKEAADNQSEGQTQPNPQSTGN